jgi:hypothetical protein
LEKEPTRRQLIGSKPREQLPKQFLKRMEKHMRKSQAFKPDPRDQMADNENEADGDEYYEQDYDEAEVGLNKRQRITDDEQQ